MLVFKSLHPPPLSFPQQFASSPTSASNRSLMKSARLTLDQPLYLCPPPLHRRLRKIMKLAFRSSIKTCLINSGLSFPSDPAVGAEPGEV